MLAVFYHEMLFRSWAQRVERNDQTLKIEAECTGVQDRVIAAAKQRLSLVENLMRKPTTRTSPLDNRGDAVESALAKQCDAADALAKRANDAAKMMASKQQELEHVQAAVVHSHASGGVKKVEYGGGAVLTPYRKQGDGSWKMIENSVTASARARSSSRR